MTRKQLFQWRLEPGTGKAIELKAGQVLRIEQIEGQQCVDFNCFNLHDYKEFMHCGRTRTVHGFNPTRGSFLWSAPPRERALMYILQDTYGRNDVLFPRCSAYLYESAYGFSNHTNCHDIQAEAQREYGLTPDDVHDSFNFFMCTEVTADGRATITRQASKAGDYVDLLALVDVLAVPNVCGADIMRTSNFSLKPIQVTVFEATEEELASVPRTPALASQRTPRDFRNAVIKADRALTRDPEYTPTFTNFPLVEHAIEVELTEGEVAMLDALRLDEHEKRDGAALRDIVFSWWEERFLSANSGAPDIIDR
ncbi:MAG: urea carboxylase-associated family protein [Microvirga sp.]